jgi:hypothetical protein
VRVRIEQVYIEDEHLSGWDYVWELFDEDGAQVSGGRASTRVRADAAARRAAAAARRAARGNAVWEYEV